jgi:hypothetical protein
LEAYCVFPTTRNGTFKVYIGSGSGSYYIGIGNQYTPGTTFDLIVDSYILVNYNLRT